MAPTKAHGWRRRLRSWLLTTLAVAALTLVAGWLALNSARGRALLERQLSAYLSEYFVGTIHVADLSSVSPFRLQLGRVSVEDASGQRVLELVDVAVRAGLLPLVWPSGGVRKLDRLSIGKTRVLLLRDDAQAPFSLLTALGRAPRDTPPEPGAAVPWQLSAVHLTRVEVQLALEDSVLLDLTAAHLDGSLRQEGTALVWQALPFRLAVGIAAQPSGPFADPELWSWKGRAESEGRFPGSSRLGLRGQVADVPLNLGAELSEQAFDVTALVEGLPPELGRRYWGSYPLRVPAVGEVRLQGSFDRPHSPGVLQLSANLATPSSQLSAELSAPWDAPGEIAFELSSEGCDSSDVGWPGVAPRVGFRLHGSTQFQARDQFYVQATGDLFPGIIAGHGVPEVEVEFEASPGLWALEAVTREPGVLLHAGLSAENDTLNWRLDFDDLQLQRWQRYPHAHDARGSLQASGTLKQQQLLGQLQGQLSQVRLSVDENTSISAESLSTQLDFRGSLTHPAALTWQGSAELRGVQAGSWRLDPLRARLFGPLSQLAVEVDAVDGEGRALQLQGRLSGLLQAAPVLSAGTLKVQHQGIRLEAQISRFAPWEPALRVAHFDVSDSAGRGSGSLSILPSSLELQFSSAQLSIEALARAAGLELPIAGRTAVDLQLVAGPDLTRGRLALSLEQVQVAGFGSLAATLTAELDGRQLRASLDGAEASAGKFAGEAEVLLAGEPLDPASYRRATGSGRLRIQGPELSTLSWLLPESWPVSNLSGAIGLELLASRSSGDRAPAIFCNMAVDRLGLDTRPPLRAQRFDNLGAYLGSALDLEAGQLQATLVGLDPRGEWLSANAHWLLASGPMPQSLAAVLELLTEAPINGVLSLPARQLHEFPLSALPSNISGQVSALVNVEGTLLEPQLFTTLAGTELRASESSVPVDLHAQAGYAHDPSAPGGRQLQARGELKHAGASVGTLRVHGQRLEQSSPSWEASASFSGLPVSLLPWTAAYDVDARLHGAATLHASPTQQQLSADLTLAELRVGEHDFGTLQLALQRRGTTLTGSARQLGPTDSSLPASFTATLEAQAQLDTLLPHQLQLSLALHDFNAGFFAPFLQPVLTRTRGQVSGNFEFEFTRPPQGIWTTRGQGLAEIRAATLHVPLLGITLQRGRAQAALTSRGSSATLLLSQIRASAHAKGDNVQGEIALSFDNLALASTNGQLQLQEVPVTIQGVPRGHLSGEIGFALDHDDELAKLQIMLQGVRVELPAASSQSLVDLAPHPEIRVLQTEQPHAEAASARRWSIAFDLGQGVEIVRADASVKVRGKPTLRIDQSVRPIGRVSLVPGGRIPVFGRVLRVEQGSVTLNPSEPDNPDVDVMGSWRATDGTVVYVRVAGPWKEERPPQIWSDPALPEDQALGLLIGASATGEAGAGQALTAGGGVALSSVGQLLGEKLPDVELRVDAPSETTDYGAAAAVRINPDLWVETQYARASNATGFTQSNRVLTGVVDYRLSPRWSLRTEVGTAGGTLEALWRYRY